MSLHIIYGLLKLFTVSKGSHNEWFVKVECTTINYIYWINSYSYYENCLHIYDANLYVNFPILKVRNFRLWFKIRKCPLNIMSLKTIRH